MKQEHIDYLKLNGYEYNGMTGNYHDFKRSEDTLETIKVRADDESWLHYVRFVQHARQEPYANTIANTAVMDSVNFALAMHAIGAVHMRAPDTIKKEAFDF